MATPARSGRPSIKKDAKQFRIWSSRAGQRRDRSTFDPLLEAQDAARTCRSAAEPSRPAAARRRHDFPDRRFAYRALMARAAPRRQPIEAGSRERRRRMR